MQQTETAKPDPTDIGQGTATYCPEDNKLRLYVGRVARPTYDWLRALGFSSTPKQDCDFVATWTPDREDAALLLIDDDDDIGDEDQSPEDRAADRAERFAGYRDKRRAEAHGLADRYEDGPGAYGSQDGRRAERAALRRDRLGGRAVTQWGKAEYWTQRTAGVIGHALYNSTPRVRRGRILRLETEARRAFGGWPVPEDGRDKWTPKSLRWLDHYENRLAYENAMIADQGGKASECDMIPGGFIGKHQICKVNKSNTTGRVVSVGIWAEHPYRKNPDGSPVMGPQTVNIERFGADAYRAPTDAELETFAEDMKRRKDEKKAKTPAAPKLINPTPEDAQRLQDALNAHMRAIYEDDSNRYAIQPPPVSEIVTMTQAGYSARSRGSYGPCETAYVAEGGRIVRTNMGIGYGRDKNLARLCKVRIMSPSGERAYRAAYRVVVLTDKPQKPLPDWTPAEAEAETANA